jgi:hypothetical protein
MNADAHTVPVPPVYQPAAVVYLQGQLAAAQRDIANLLLTLEAVSAERDRLRAELGRAG